MVTEKEAEQIRADYKAGMSYRELAKKHRKSLRDIAKIIKGGAVGEAREEEVIMSWELPYNIKGTVHTKNGYSLSDAVTDAVEWLMEKPVQKFLDPGYSYNPRSILFDLINLATRHGINPHREDLHKVLRGTLEFAVMRWIKKGS